MAEYHCDVCGEVIEGYQFPRNTLDIGGLSQLRLCLLCIEATRLFLRSRRLALQQQSSDVKVVRDA